jgi:hypothetical protein
MTSKARTNVSRWRNPEAGSLLLETMIAIILLLIVAVGVLSLAGTSIEMTENQGHLMTRTAEYSQDKMEQLLALAYCDASTDTTQIPSQPTGGTGLAGCPTPLASPATGTGLGGSSDPSNPVASYVDYLDVSGKFTSGAAGTSWFYIRTWQISAGPGGVTNMKQITVTTRVNHQIGAGGLVPQTSLTVLKSYPF